MTEETAAVFQRDGDQAFTTENNEGDSSSDSQSDDKSQNGDTQSAEGENAQTEKDLPFHEHPRWKQREEEWNTRFNSQEVRHADELKQALEAIRLEFKSDRQANADNTKIPAWFGGDQSQWDAYRADRDAELQAAEARAEAKAYERITRESTNQSTAIEQATQYMRSEIEAIENDKTLNPNGVKIDPELLLKVVLENELVDSKQRWNYRAGFKLMQSMQPAPATPPKVDTQEKKKLAGALGSDSKGETKEQAFKTTKDFKTNRPW